MKKLAKFLCICICAGLAVSLSACSLFPQKKAENENVTPVELGIQYIENMSDLQRGNVYVETKHGYASPYWGNPTFNTTDKAKQSMVSKVVWFNENDWKLIPTIYKGQHIVYRTDQDFDEKFYFEKYYDAKYTIGLCNLTPTETGRYKFSTASDNTAQINMESEAASVLEFGGANVIMDAIGGRPLRSDMMTPCGSIARLEKDAYFKADLYVGTEYKAHNFKADSRLLYSMQMNQTNSYRFVQAEIIEIDIPEYFESGYYSMNGTGIFRYINENAPTNGDVDFENMDLNKPNESESNYNSLSLGTEDYYKTDVRETITIPVDGNYSLDIYYDNNVNRDLLPEEMNISEITAPKAIFHIDNEDVEFYEIGENTLSNTFYASAGNYELEVTGTYGRSFYDMLMYLDGELEYDYGDTAEDSEVVEETAEEEPPVEEIDERLATEKANDAEAVAAAAAEAAATEEIPIETETAPAE